MNNKLFFAIGLAATLLQAPVTVSAQSSGTSQQNPLLMKSNLPFGAPDFSRIKESDYLPAIEAAIKIKRDNIQKIVDNKKKPTFQNTISLSRRVVSCSTAFAASSSALPMPTRLPCWPKPRTR